MEEYHARCMHCKKEIVVKDPEVVQMKGKGKSTIPAVRGKCPDCGTSVYRILPKVYRILPKNKNL